MVIRLAMVGSTSVVHLPALVFDQPEPHAGHPIDSGLRAGAPTLAGIHAGTPTSTGVRAGTPALSGPYAGTPTSNDLRAGTP
jgi:hypothetical protein